MVTIKDIATRVGVTAATVSLALNGKSGVSEATRKKVLHAAEEMNYYPSSTAKSLRQGRSKTIGIIVGSLENEFFYDIVSSIERYASICGYSIMVCGADRNPDKVIPALKTLYSRGVDGIIFSVGFFVPDEIESVIAIGHAMGIKHVSLTPVISSPFVPVVHSSEDEDMERAVKLLSSLGHKRIGCVVTEEGTWLCDYRFRKFRKSLERHGLYESDNVEHGSISMEGGKEAARRLLRRHPELTAVFVVADTMGIGVMAAAGELSYSVPSDLSIFSCDGVALCDYTNPPLTTISLPRHEMGRTGVEMLISLIEGRRENFPPLTLIKSSIKYGSSIAKVRQW